MARGYGHRKLYPYVTKKQAQIAPGMPKFIAANKNDLTEQGNQVLSGPGSMTKRQSKGKLSKAWSNVQSKGVKPRKISQYIDAHGGSRGRAKKILVQHHAVQFGQDPFNK